MREVPSWDFDGLRFWGECKYLYSFNEKINRVGILIGYLAVFSNNIRRETAEYKVGKTEIK
jgi:hypothetical protein